MNRVHSARVSLDRRDMLLALGTGVVALMVYTRVLAPDVLYSDSAEFQTLAYTGGMTHPTGYPVYLLLTHLFGTIPISTFAWRINFFSALAAAYTLAGSYLVTRHFSGRGGALLSSLVLMVSYMFWSQSIIAEVYTPAAAFIVTVMLALLHWSDHSTARHGWLFAGFLLITLGLGVHLFLALVLPAAVLLILVTMGRGDAEVHADWRRTIGLAVLGGLVGMVVFYVLFARFDSRSTPASFFETTLLPSRDAWGLQVSDMDTTPERFWLSVSGVQWRDAMIPASLDYLRELTLLWEDYLPREFSIPALALATVGVLTAFVTRRSAFVLPGALLVIGFLSALVYEPGDKFIFYLPAYLPLVIFVGVGTDRITGWAGRLMPSALLRQGVESVVFLGLIMVCIGPFFQTRWRAVQIGRSTFVTDTYPYPVDSNLSEPRRVAECAVSEMPESDPVLVMGWRAIYSIYYVAYVDGRHPGLVIYEARPHGTQQITPMLQAEMKAALDAGRAVYADGQYPELRRDFMLTRLGGTCPGFPIWRVELRS